MRLIEILNIGSSNPTFVWMPVIERTQCRLKVVKANHPNEPIFEALYEVEDVFSDSDQICSIEPDPAPYLEQDTYYSSRIHTTGDEFRPLIAREKGPGAIIRALDTCFGLQADRLSYPLGVSYPPTHQPLLDGSLFSHRIPSAGDQLPGRRGHYRG